MGGLTKDTPRKKRAARSSRLASLPPRLRQTFLDVDKTSVELLQSARAAVAAEETTKAAANKLVSSLLQIGALCRSIKFTEKYRIGLPGSDDLEARLQEGRKGLMQALDSSPAASIAMGELSDVFLAKARLNGEFVGRWMVGRGELIAVSEGQDYVVRRATGVFER